LWIAVAVVVIAMLGLAFSGVQPFARLSLSFDPEWFEVVRGRDSFYFLTLWGPNDWIPIFNMLVLAAFGLTVAEANERRFLSTVIAVGIGGLVFSLIGGDVFRNVLVADIQAWRTTWLLALVAHLFVARIFFRIQTLRKSSSIVNVASFFALAIGLLALSQFFRPLSAPATAMLVIAGIVGLWELENRAIPFTVRLLVTLFGEFTLAVAVIFLYISISNINISVASPDALRDPMRAIALVVIALAAMGALLIEKRNSRKQDICSVVILCLAVALVTVAGFVWDQRTPWTRFVDTTEAPPDSLTSLLPGRSPVYWEGDVTVPWFLLKRPSYFSCEQGTGTIFSRSTAVNYQSRYKSFQSLRPLDFENCGRRSDYAITPLTRTELSSVCEREPGLAMSVLTQAVIGVPERTWVSPVKFVAAKKVDGKWTVFATDKFYIYSCADL